MNSITGIYKITNKMNQKIYIGQALDILSRWRQHSIQYLNKNNKISYNCIFYKALRKYGIDNFSFEILEVCNEAMLNDKESFYINKYRTYVGFEDCNGYNMTLGGNNSTITNKKKIVQYSLNGEKIAEFNSISEAKRQTGVIHIFEVLQHKRRSSGGFLWSYENELPHEYYEYIPVQSKKIVQYDLKGNFICCYNSIKEAVEKTGLTSLSYCLRNKNPKVGNFLWSYEGQDIPEYTNKHKLANRKKVFQYDENWNLLQIFNSVTEATKLTGIKNISACCRGTREKAGGYKWSYTLKKEV